MVVTFTIAFKLPRITLVSEPNSAITCLHAPHGVAGSSASVQTAMSVIFVSPSAIAQKIATRSAQIESPYDAFSTLQPT